MATTWGFYSDPGLTSLVSSGATLVDGAGAIDRLVYFGSPAPGKTLQAASLPGTDAIEVSPADADALGGAAVTNIKLALSVGGLDAAVAGAALSIGTTLESGPGGAVPIYVRTLQGSLVVGIYDDLSLTTNGLVET